MPDWTFEPAKDIGLTPAQRAASLRRESSLLDTIGHALSWACIRAYLRVWHRVRVEGRARLPRAAPFVLIANHTSHLDALVVAAPLAWRLRDRSFPIAAGDVFFNNPAASVFASAVINALPLWRKKAVAHAMESLRARLLEEPAGFILFPEGARSRDGSLMPFKAGLGMLVAGTSAPVIPCLLRGCAKALPPGARVPRPRRIDLIVGEALTFHDVTNDREGWAEVSRRARLAVEALGATTR